MNGHGSEAAADVHLALDGRKERLQPFIRGSVRKVAGEDLAGMG